MNAIALLSGWAGSSGSSQGARTGRSQSRSRYSNGKGKNVDVEISPDADGLAANDATANDVNVTSTSASTSSSLRDTALKPPEARLYEELEAQNALASHASDAPAHTVRLDEQPDLSTIYPTPPPTPPILLSSLQDSTSSSPLGESLTKTEKPVSSSTQDRSVALEEQRDRHARQLARSYPVRCLTRLYILLRRFLALFGIQLDPAASAPISASLYPEARQTQPPILASPLSDAPSSSSQAPPPSYADATRLPSSSSTAGNSLQTRTTTSPQQPSPPRRSRWRIPGFRATRRPPPVPLIPIDEDGGSSSDSSTLLPSQVDEASASLPLLSEKRKKRKLDLSPSPPSIPSSPSIPGGSPSLSSSGRPRNSVAQIALSKPKLLVLDLDETLIHSTSCVGLVGGFNPVTSADGNSRWNANTSGLKVRVVEVVLDGRSVIYHVYKRPWVDFFLKKVGV